MTVVLKEVNAAIVRLGLGSRVRALGDAEASTVTAAVLARFVGGRHRRWWWEAFPEPSASITFEDDKGFLHICELVPEPNSKCWFVVEDGGARSFPLFEASPRDAMQAVCECSTFEYYIVDKDLAWIVCETHHGTIVGSGEPVTLAIQRVARHLSMPPSS